MPEAGYEGEYRISGLFGANDADGCGRVMFGMEYASR